jgi:Zn-dependent membrane protease YugP
MRACGCVCVDGVNFTRDDLHVWLAPLGHTPPLVAIITIVFQDVTTLSMVRIWNYNKSRTHSGRGVRQARVKLDQEIIFEGEIRRAPGLLSSCQDCSEKLLFLPSSSSSSHTSSAAMENIAAYDAHMGYQVRTLSH